MVFYYSEYLLEEVDQAEIGQPFVLKVVRNSRELSISIKPAALPEFS